MPVSIETKRCTNCSWPISIVKIRMRAPSVAALSATESRKLRLSHAGATCEDQQVAALQAAEQFVQVAEASRQAERLIRVLDQVLDALEIAVDGVAHRDQFAAQVALGDVEQPRLGVAGDFFDGNCSSIASALISSAAISRRRRTRRARPDARRLRREPRSACC